VVEIDYQIPGCAPSGDVIFDDASQPADGRFRGFEREKIRFD
jgi:NAD-reducing hydrogenase small subunit